jgi:hypothetical protein
MYEKRPAAPGFYDLQQAHAARVVACAPKPYGPRSEETLMPNDMVVYIPSLESRTPGF